MLNGLFELVAGTLNFFYELTHNYAIDDRDAAVATPDPPDPDAVQGRSPEAQRRVDGLLQGAPDQPGGRLPAVDHPGAGVLDPLLRDPRADHAGQVRGRSGDAGELPPQPGDAHHARVPAQVRTQLDRAVPVAGRPFDDDVVRHQPGRQRGGGADQGLPPRPPLPRARGDHRWAQL